MHEELLRSGPLPVRGLRAAQFHEFVGQLLEWQQDGVAYIPALPTQLVACRAVAEELVDLAIDPAEPVPGTPIPEIAGPRKEIMAEAAALLGARRGVKVVGIDGSRIPDGEIPDGEIAANGGGSTPSLEPGIDQDSTLVDRAPVGMAAAYVVVSSPGGVFSASRRRRVSRA
ncbi:hypothetical protein [Amycolatopsis regifaucium]|uniref:hypothetical protein n=1 Tax=Amycolatopsis regifaucium TaxID=546365 RepID=UPI0008F63B76|nr:hypothetical protein [Amycolatopsis regifaucium]SFH62083.1 hypothetical protein SAMN04489731_105278 [Amycolatopsis regifaucium]